MFIKALGVKRKLFNLIHALKIDKIPKKLILKLLKMQILCA